MSCTGNCESCSLNGTCGNAGAPLAMQTALQGIKETMENIKHKILILSGKGGVGKSTVSYILSKSFAENETVGVLDLDLCGPSMPFLFNHPYDDMLNTAYGFQPCFVTHNVRLISIQYFLENEDDPLIARGPMKNSLILQFLKDVDWSEIDTLIIDTPPGTSDEHLSVVSFLADTGIDGAIIVTTPEELSLSDVRREIYFCRKANVKILGIIENMSNFVCPKCKKESKVYPETTGGAKHLCEKEKLTLLGSFPIDPSIVAGCVGEKYKISQPIITVANSIRDKLNESFQEKD